MDGVEGKDALLRIERGRATEEELAAVAVTLFSLVAAQSGLRAADGGRSLARWSRRERTRVYQAPHSWR